LGRARALKLGITKGLSRTAQVVLPKAYKCPVCKYEFKAFDVAVESKNTGKSAELIVAGHVIQCIGRLGGQAQCPDCGKSVKGKDFKEHMDINHPMKNEQGEFPIEK